MYTRWDLVAWDVHGRMYVYVGWKAWVVVTSNEIKTTDEEYTVSVITVYFCFCYFFYGIYLFTVWSGYFTAFTSSFFKLYIKTELFNIICKVAKSPINFTPGLVLH